MLTDTASLFLPCLVDSVFWICQFVQRSDDLILRFVDLSNDFVTVMNDRPEDPSEGYDLQDFFANDLYVMIRQYFGSVFWVPLRS